MQFLDPSISDGTYWLNGEENLVAPGIIDSNKVFLFFKGDLMGNQTLFDLQQSLTRRDSDRIGLQTGAVRGCGFCLERVPGIQTDVMMIATSADEKRPWITAGHV